MTKEELKLQREVKEWLATDHNGYIVQSLMNFIRKQTEPREKRIAELTEQNTSLLTSVENLNKSVQELEAQIEKMKCCGNCAKYNSGYGENPCKIGASMICGEWETSIGKF